jgi:hypothetical protein
MKKGGNVVSKGRDEDLRVIQTKRAIREALVQLIEEKALKQLRSKILQQEQTSIEKRFMPTIKIRLI